MFRYYKARLFLGAIVLFIVSCVKSCDEARYLLVGRKTPATQVQVADLEDRTAVKFQYKDGETVREGYDHESQGWRPSGPVMVQFIPGSAEDCRLAGHPQWWWTLAPLLLAGFIGYHSWKFWKFYKS